MARLKIREIRKGKKKTVDWLADELGKLGHTSRRQTVAASGNITWSFSWMSVPK